MAFKDFWTQDNNRLTYAHIKPEMIHECNGRKVGWDIGNGCFRYLNASEDWFIGTPDEIPKRKEVSDEEFIKAFHKNRKSGNGLEGLIKDLGYFKNSVQSIRVVVSTINKKIVETIRDKIGRAHV